MTLLQQQILDVLGGDELTAQEITDRIRDQTVSMQLVSAARLNLALVGLVKAGTLKIDWRDPEPTTRTYGRRVYRKAQS